MQSTQDNNRSIQRHRHAGYPALAALRLDAADLDELTRQGFVCGEARGQRRYFKLRFRRGGKQVVRYIGNAEHADIIKNELLALQAESRTTRELRTIARLASKMLRDAKTQLTPILESNGLAFHGLSIRRPHKRATGIPTSPSESDQSERNR